MSLLDKVKNLFYEDGEEEPIKSEMIQVDRKSTRLNSSHTS